MAPTKEIQKVFQEIGISISDKGLRGELIKGAFSPNIIISQIVEKFWKQRSLPDNDIIHLMGYIHRFPHVNNWNGLHPVLSFQGMWQLDEFRELALPKKKLFMVNLVYQTQALIVSRSEFNKLVELHFGNYIIKRIPKSISSCESSSRSTLEALLD